MIELTVKTLDSQNHPFSVPDDTTVKQLKERIAETVNVPVDVQRMIYCGRVLQDEKALSEYDVNGKVIHLVQRPPPQPNSSGGTDPQSRSGSSPSGQPGRRTVRPRIDGNAMYLGAMAFPADLMDAQGIQPPQPSHSLSRSRLTLAMQMLNRAKNSLNKLENPESQQSPGVETPPDEADNGSEPPDQPEEVGEREPLPATLGLQSEDGLTRVAAAAAIAAAVTAAQSMRLPPGMTIVRGEDEEQRGGQVPRPPGDDNLEIPEQEEVMLERGTLNVSHHTLQLGLSDEGITVQAQELPPPPPPQDPASEDRSSPPRTCVMASVMDELNLVQERLQPFLQQYHQLMRDDPSYETNVEEAGTAQRVFGLVSEVMHFLSHAYHAMSDIMCDFSTPSPRILRCRPVLIQHSAVLQAGIPIQAQFNLVANRGTNTSNGQSGTRDVEGTAEAPAGRVPETPSQAQSQSAAGSVLTDAGNNLPGVHTVADENAATLQETETGAAPYTDTNVDAENARLHTSGPNESAHSRNGSRTRVAQSRSRIPRTGGAFFSPQSFSISPADVEVFMEVGPSSITIDSMETRVLDNSASEQNVDGNFPAPEFIQNLMQAMAGHVMGRVGAPGAPSSTSAAAAITTNNNSSSSQAQAGDGARPGQNSQARGNTATHPTTSTQTRSTSRPHVHLAPSSVHSALGTSNFDPFLPCNSHHIRSGRRRRAPRLSPTVTFTTDRPPRSMGMNVGFIPTSHSEQTSQSENPSPATSQPTPPPPPLQPQQTAEPNLINFFDMFGGLAANILSNANNILSSEGSGPLPGTQAREDVSSAGFQQFLHGLLGPGAQTGMADNAPGMQSLLQGFPLFQVFTGSTNGQSPSLIELVQNFAAQPESEGEHLLTDFVMTMARGLTFQDLCMLRMGNTRPLQSLRPQLREFVQQQVLQGEAPSSESIARGVDRLLALLRPHFNILLEARIREDVDVISTVNHYHQIRLPEVLELISNEGENSNFGNQAAAWWKRYYKELLAILLYCCVDKTQGLETIMRSYVLQMTQAVSPLIQQTTVSCCLNYVRSSVAQSTVSQDDIQPFIVYRMGSTESQPASACPVLQMETDAVGEEQPTEEVVPEVLLGSEAWHGDVPSDWVPIISRDIQRQRRQNPLTPFSDAYLSGMPSKRRKVVTSTKPETDLNEAITETVRSALETAGVGPVPLREVVSQAAGSDPSIQTAYSDHMCTLVHDRLATSPDFSTERFPNTARYFSK